MTDGSSHKFVGFGGTVAGSAGGPSDDDLKRLVRAAFERLTGGPLGPSVGHLVDSTLTGRVREWLGRGDGYMMVTLWWLARGDAKDGCSPVVPAAERVVEVQPEPPESDGTDRGSDGTVLELVREYEAGCGG